MRILNRAKVLSWLGAVTHRLRPKQLLTGMVLLSVQTAMAQAPAAGGSTLPACPGSQSSWTWNDCQGTVDMGGGERYVGEMKAGRFHGRGTYEWPGGGRYVGQWKDGGREGQGTQLAGPQDRYDPKAVHDQPWSKNTPYSMIVNQAAGSQYEGAWKANRKEGQGQLRLPNGDQYVGTFKDDAFEGTGTWTPAHGGGTRHGLWSANRFVKELPIARSEPLGKKKALVIGNDRYTRVDRLENAVADAKAIAATLEKLGYQVTFKNDLDDRALKASLRQFKGTVEGGDEVVFFFAGHGVQIGSANYLLPVDIRQESEEQVRDDALPLQRVLEDFSERRARLTLAIIDACRTNPFPRTGRSIGGRGLAPTTAATGQMVIFSAGTGQEALDKLDDKDRNPNGLFTRILLKEIVVPGVRIDNVIREVRKQVVEAARGAGHEQVPAIYDQVVGDFYFSR
ncbi:MAG: caspase family protein [Burkholderiaceae bacterium]